MKVGAENRTKVIAAVALFALAVFLLIHMLAGNDSTSASTAANSPTTPQTAPVRQSQRPRGSHRFASTHGDQPRQIAAATPSLDPRLRLDLLKESESTAYRGSGRNIFEPGMEDIPKPIHPPINIGKTSPPPIQQGPPPPPPINLKFFGFANEPGEPRQVFLAQGDDVFVAREGEIVDRRYRVVRIMPNAVEVQDVLNNNTQTIPLTQG